MPSDIEQMTAKEMSAEIAAKVMGWRVVHYVGPEKVEGYVYPFNHYYEAPDGIVRNDVQNEYSFWSPSTKIEHAFEMEAEIKRQGKAREYGQALFFQVSGITAESMGDCYFLIAHASPLDRCKAALALHAARTEASK